jgi:hypothetical protein
VFDSFITNKQKIRGNAIKKEVVFELRGGKIPKAKSQSISMAPGSIPQDDTINVVRGGANNNNYQTANTTNEKELKDQLESLKVEYLKHKNQLILLKDKHTQLKNRVDMERPTNTTITGGANKTQSKKMIYNINIKIWTFL